MNDITLHRIILCTVSIYFLRYVDDSYLLSFLGVRDITANIVNEARLIVQC